MTVAWASAAADAFDPPPVPDVIAGPVNYAVARSRGEYRDYRHCRVIEQAILETIDTGGRLIIEVSVRHSKSQTTSRWTPAWFIGRNPDKRVILGAHRGAFARRWGRRARDILTEHGPADFGIKVDPHSQAADYWDVEGRAGGMVTVGVGGSPTGEGADLLLIDDPIKSFKDAMSPLVRRNVIEWWTGTMASRIAPGGAAIIIMARWHVDDLSGYLQREDPDTWRVLRMPAICDDPEHDPMGRAEGEPLWPEVWSAEALAKARHDVTQALGQAVWNAQYQARPQPPGGDIFPEEKWGYMLPGEVPSRLRWVRGWDLAATKSDGDWTVGVLMAKLPDDRTVVADVRRGQWSADEVRTQIRLAAADDPPGTQVELPQDPGQAGKDQGTQLVRMLSGRNAHARPVSGNKVVRATGYAAQQQAGNVVLVNAAWNPAFTDEHRDFPNGQHDDQVDAAATGFNALWGTSSPGVRWLG